MFEVIIKHFPEELRGLIIHVLDESSQRELRFHKMERDPMYVLEYMGLAFKKYEKFIYRGYVFDLVRFRDSPSMYESPLDYRVNMCCPYPKGSDYRHGEDFGDIDFNDCHLISLEQFIQHLIDNNFPHEPDYPNDWINDAYKMLENQDMENLQELLQNMYDNALHQL